MSISDGSRESLGAVTVGVNWFCTVVEYPVLVTFGAQVIGSDMCEGQTATLKWLLAGASSIFSVDRDTITLRDNEEYCYIVSIGEAGELTPRTIFTVPEHVHKHTS